MINTTNRLFDIPQTYNRSKPLTVTSIRKEEAVKKVSCSIQFSKEDDGKWIAQVIELPGVMVYGNTQNEATVKIKTLALETISDQIKYGETPANINQINFNTMNTMKSIKNIFKETNLFLEGLFTFREPDMIWSYLTRNQDLTSYLSQSQKIIKDIFGISTQLFLEVENDAEYSGQSLWVNIQTEYTVDQALAMMNEFDNKWYLPNVDKLGMRLAYNLEKP